MLPAGATSTILYISWNWNALSWDERGSKRIHFAPTCRLQWKYAPVSFESEGHTVSRRLGSGRIDCRRTDCQQNVCANKHMACTLHGYLKPGRIEIALAGVSETLDLITRARMQHLRAKRRPKLRSAMRNAASHTS